MFVRAVYQEILVLFQKWYKKVPQNGENAYLVMNTQELLGP